MRSSTLHLWIAAFVAAVTFSPSASANAPWLSWTQGAGAESCIAHEELTAAVREDLREYSSLLHALDQEARIQALGRVERFEEAPRWRASVTVRAFDGTKLVERHLEEPGEDCRAIDAALFVMIATALRSQSDVATGARMVEPPAPPQPPAPPPAPAASSTTETAVQVETPEDRPRNTLSINIGATILQAVLSGHTLIEIEYERALARKLSLFIAPEFLVGDGAVAIGLQMGPRFFMTGTAPAGLWLAPMVEFAYARGSGRGAIGVGAHLQFGGSVIIGDVFDLSLGVGVGWASVTALEEEPGFRNSLSGLTIPVRLSIGAAF